MKLAISADLHLGDKNNRPERYNALSDLFNQCLDQHVDKIILAGDVFDQTWQNYSDFEGLCKDKRYSPLAIHIIPGNHDPNISNKSIVCENVNIHSEPEWVDLCEGWACLFIPYRKNMLMGEVIQENIHNKPQDNWMLIGHGDWSRGLKEPNIYEPGTYMPLTQRDIQSFRPDLIFLGHIHAKCQIGNLHYPGSPCGMDITETNYRHFLILDTQTSQVTANRVNNDKIFFNENLLILPKDDETDYLEKQIKNLIDKWSLSPGDESKVYVRIKVRGYSTNRDNLMKVIKKNFKSYNLYDEPDILEVSTVNDPDRDYLMNKVLETISEYEVPQGSDDAGTDEIILDAMNLIYGER